MPSRLEWRGSHIGVSWSPDGTHVMTAMQECGLHGWRVSDGKDMAVSGYAAKVRSMDWLAKPPVLATSGAECVIGWPFAGSGPRGKPPLEIGLGIGRLVTQAGVDDGAAAVCELAAGGGRAVRVRPAGGGRVSALAWSRDGARLATGTDAGTLSVFDLSS